MGLYQGARQRLRNHIQLGSRGRAFRLGAIALMVLLTVSVGAPLGMLLGAVSSRREPVHPTRGPSTAEDVREVDLWWLWEDDLGDARG